MNKGDGDGGGSDEVDDLLDMADITNMVVTKTGTCGKGEDLLGKQKDEVEGD